MNESEQALPPPSYDDEIDLRELFRVLWAGKWLIGGITVAAMAVAVIFALMLPNIYRAEALLAPNDAGGASGLSTLASQYGGLASLAGIDLGTDSADDAAVGLEILKSRKFVTQFIERHDLLVPLMAATSWDARSGELNLDRDIYDAGALKWTRRVDPPRDAVPSMQEAYKKFSEIMSVDDRVFGFVIISIEHFSPNIAKQWVDWLVDDLNSTIMYQDVAEAEQAIDYLHEQIERTSISELQAVFFNLIEEQTKTVMLAKVTDQYLFRILDPAVAPEVKSKPNRSLIIILSAIFGILIGTVIVLVSAAIRGGFNT